MNTGIVDIQTSTSNIHEQLRILSHVVLEFVDSGSTNSGNTPQKTEVVNSDNKTQLEDNTDKSKRKFLAESNGNIHEVLISSDEEDDLLSKRFCRSQPTMKMAESLDTVKPQIPSSWTQCQILPRGKAPLGYHTTTACTNDFRRTSDKAVDPSPVTNEISKRLFQTPSPVQRNIQEILASLKQYDESSGLHEEVQGNTQHNSGKGKAKDTPTRSGGLRTPWGFLPKGVRLKFRPTLDMNLSVDEIKLAVYT